MLVMMLSYDSYNHGILKWITEGVRFVTPRQSEALRYKDRESTRLWKAVKHRRSNSLRYKDRVNAAERLLMSFLFFIFYFRRMR